MNTSRHKKAPADDKGKRGIFYKIFLGEQPEKTHSKKSLTIKLTELFYESKL